MGTNNVIYTDGRNVTVTEQTLKVKNSQYNLNGITKHGMLVLKGRKFPGIALLLLGALLVVLGALGLMPFGLENPPGDAYMGSNTLAIWIGAGFTLIGILIISLAKDRYAVHIATAEGEKNVVVSDQKEYVRQIVDAINEAYKRLGIDTSYAA